MQEPFVRVTSTANRIGRAWFARLFRLFIFYDLIAVLLLCGAFAYYCEKDVYGDWWQPQMDRRLQFDPSCYRFRLAGESEWNEVYFGEDLRKLAPVGYAILGIEAIELIKQGRWGARKARKLLRPLDKMARAARELAQMQAQPRQMEEKTDLHELEEAIGRISPGDKLKTGDIELEGLENAINAMLARMQETYRQQARFVSDASHELRTPIAVVQGYAGILKRWGREDPKVLDEAVEAIAAESDYMKKLVDQLLFLARGDTGRNRMEMKRVNVAEIVQEARDDAALIDKKHEWTLGKCEDAFVTADPDMLKQCVRILTENAARYTPEGGTVRLQILCREGQACMEVQDTGCGIAREDISHVFERFYRADAARSRESGGSGLGLSIAGWIVENHGGHIDVLSREGLGTRFSVCLPLEMKKNI